MTTRRPPDHPWRSHPVHQPVHLDSTGAAIVLVTVVTARRWPILATPETHQILAEAWTAADNWLAGRYVVMPDHVHVFVAPTARASSLTQWVKYWKSRASRHWPRPADHPIWQPDYWDTQLRSTESYDARWEYVLQNPQRAGLVADGREWPYHGELNGLPWVGR